MKMLRTTEVAGRHPEPVCGGNQRRTEKGTNRSALCAGPCRGEDNPRCLNPTRFQQWVFEIDQKWRAGLQLAKATQKKQKKSGAALVRASILLDFKTYKKTLEKSAPSTSPQTTHCSYRSSV